MAYHLTCNDCSFERTLETGMECLEAVDDHKRMVGSDHTVEFEVHDEPPLLEGGVSSLDGLSSKKLET